MAAELLFSKEKIAVLKGKFSELENDDGSIGVGKLEELMTSLGKCFPQTELRKKINKVGDDGNGTITFSEFLTILAGETDWAYSQYRTAFNAMDKNKDGFLSADELREAMSTIAQPMTDEQIDAFIKRADYNEDGKFDRDEFTMMVLDEMVRF
ncbi:calmodulin-2/4 [Strongylocentrotus purpuratus]|uniref:EF-hand domain-containing protein n=1 Tax=Strongylocentrotus purpuratus TaxID=7668 RepID=A0A7M7RGE1_STRPU|nr:calmodulin-2/4 [Strongylocentrotus purpuratus]|eukprot:XP_789976.1 PREDICTED: calmodulin-2/4 [Strongylocentrotus purpuratus]